MLELHPCCKCCGRTLRVDDPDVYICSFECTWCAGCTASFPDRACPDCGGNLTPRPVRPAALLGKYPPSTRRVVDASCAERFARPADRRPLSPGAPPR